MKILVTGSAGHLGEALMRTLLQEKDFPHHEEEYEAIGIDLVESDYTDRVGNIADRNFVKQCFDEEEENNIDVVIHTATLHKPHIGTHSKQDFVDTNITGTLNLLEECCVAAVGRTNRSPVKAFVFTSSTSTFGDAMTTATAPSSSSNNNNPIMIPWITEDTVPIPKNIYGVTKIAAEDMCQLFHRNNSNGLSCVVLKTSRFFPESDDCAQKRSEFSNDDNCKANEFLYRRIDITDVVSAHLQAMKYALTTSMRPPSVTTTTMPRYIISATTPFQRGKHNHLLLGKDAPTAVEEVCPEYVEEYERRGWKMFQTFDRVYDNSKARKELDWEPRFSTFSMVISRLKANEPLLSPLAYKIGQKKGYHLGTSFEGLDGPYPVEEETT